MIDDIRRAMAPMSRKIAMMVGLAAVRLLTEGKGLQVVQVEGLSDETLDEVERFQDYGFVSRPKPGAEGVLLSVMGARGEAVIIAVADRRYRLRILAEGEVALHDDQGQVVHLKRDGIEATTPFNVKIDAGQVVTVTAGQSARIVAPTVVVESADVQLGGAGGRKVARIGDTVAGGVITSGSAKVTAA